MKDKRVFPYKPAIAGGIVVAMVGLIFLLLNPLRSLNLGFANLFIGLFILIGGIGICFYKGALRYKISAKFEGEAYYAGGTMQRVGVESVYSERASMIGEARVYLDGCLTNPKTGEPKEYRSGSKELMELQHDFGMVANVIEQNLPNLAGLKEMIKPEPSTQPAQLPPVQPHYPAQPMYPQYPPQPPPQYQQPPAQQPQQAQPMYPPQPPSQYPPPQYQQQPQQQYPAYQQPPTQPVQPQAKSEPTPQIQHYPAEYQQPIPQQIQPAKKGLFQRLKKLGKREKTQPVPQPAYAQPQQEITVEKTAPALQPPEKTVPPQIPKFCPDCGAETKGHTFCGNCGKKLLE